MGIKPTYIKNLGTELMEEYPDAFGPDFEENKKSVAEYTNIESKAIRNRVAGYITRRLKSKEKSKVRKEVLKEDVSGSGSGAGDTVHEG
ncbi:MAG: 30S ribosomal protein S17e [Methanocellales archaeon]|nr:30S ribosomal protein S17e [Methanocellales archaeon]